MAITKVFPLPASLTPPQKKKLTTTKKVRGTRQAGINVNDPNRRAQTFMEWCKDMMGGLNAKAVFEMAGLDLASNVLCTIGMVQAGSGPFVVIFSSMSLWSAALSWFMLGKTMTRKEMFGICLVTIGLAMSMLSTGGEDVPLPLPAAEFGEEMNLRQATGGTTVERLPEASGSALEEPEEEFEAVPGAGGEPDSPAVEGSLPEEQGDQHNVTLGMILSMIGTAVYALEYVWGEVSMGGGGHGGGAKIEDEVAPSSGGTAATDPLGFVTWMGILCSILTGIFFVFHTLPHWTEEVHSHDIALAFVWFLVVMFSSLFHNVSWLFLLESSGSTATTVMQAIRAIAVFSLSGILYCHIQASQCFSAIKGASAISVIVGVVLYSGAGNDAKSDSPSMKDRRVPDQLPGEEVQALLESRDDGVGATRRGRSQTEGVK